MFSNRETNSGQNEAPSISGISTPEVVLIIWPNPCFPYPQGAMIRFKYNIEGASQLEFNLYICMLRNF